MARTATIVSKEILINSVSQAESIQSSFATLGELWSKVSDLYNQTITEKQLQLKRITSSIVYLRVREWKIPFNTVAAKRTGMPAGVRNQTGIKRSRGDKFKSSTIAQEALAQLQATLKGREQKSFDRVVAGSLKAAIRLKCLDCSGDVKSNVTHCTVKSCSLWLFRPFQSVRVIKEDQVETVAVETE